MSAAAGVDANCVGKWLCQSKPVNDNQIYSNMYYSAAVGALCVLGFIIFRSKVAMYQCRLHLPDVLIKPPPVRLDGLHVLWSWLVPVFCVSDTELVHTAGLDALIFHRACAFGVIFFLPVTVLASALLIPLFATGGRGTVVLTTTSLSQLTMAHLPPGSALYWVPWAFVYAVLAYGCWLLLCFYQEYVDLRQRFLVKGEPVLNEWQASYLQPRAVKQSRSFPAPSAKVEHCIAKAKTDASGLPGVTPLGAGSAVRAAILSSTGPPGAGEDGGVDGGAGGGCSPRSPQASEDAGTPRLPQPPVISCFETDVAGRPALHEAILHRWWQPSTLMAAAGRPSALCGKPPVPFRRVVNVRKADGSTVTVNAQPYVVLAYDVPLPRKVTRADHRLSLVQRLPTPLALCFGPFSTLPADQLVHELAENPNTTASRLGSRSSQIGSKTLGDKPPEAETKAHTSEKGGSRSAGAAGLRSAASGAASRGSAGDSGEQAGASGGVLRVDEQGDMEQRRASTAADGKGMDGVVADGSVAADADRRQSEVAEAKESAAGAVEALRIGAETPIYGKALVEAAFSEIFPESFQTVLPVRNHKVLDFLLGKWDAACRCLDSAEAEFIANGFTRRPQHRPGRCCWKGAPVDSINTYASEVRMLEAKVLAEQQVVLQAPDDVNSYFVFFSSQKDAAAAGQCIVFNEGAEHAFRVMPAPGPDEGPSRMKGMQVLFPVGIFLGAITNLAVVVCKGNLDAGSGFCGKDSRARSLLLGIGPALLLTLWQNLIMPNMIFRSAMLTRRSVSLSGLDRQVFTLFFLWDIFNILLGAILGGSALTALGPALADPGHIYITIGEALSKSSNFFINYITVQGFLMLPFRLFWPNRYPLVTIFRIFRLARWPRSERERLENLHPHFNIRMGRELGGNLMQIWVMALAFAAIAPIILPFTLLWMVFNWVLWRYTILYINERSWESGGVIWRHTCQALIWCFFIFGVFTGCVFITNKAYYQGGSMIVTVPLILWHFHGYVARRFHSGETEAPLLLAATSPPATIDPALYMPPALRPRCAGYFPEVGKAWEHWGVPAYYP
ncbi:hypothetical protein WJX81_000456 [Elliptochloris bilobata]|uniref:ERD4-related membrane protein n=1 Tax=Elliptochloris bilobata TaxID=381761 RepID=A0AAW1QNG1_9CHLO